MITISPSYLVIDLGTSSLRTSLYSLQDGIVSLKRKDLHIGARVNVGFLWNELESLIRSMIGDNPRVEITCIGISALLGWVPVGEDGSPVEDAWTWIHQEAQQYEKCLDKIPTDFVRLTGRKFAAEMGVLKWTAMKENTPSTYKRVQSFISIKDYFVYRLTGSMCMDYTHAAYTGVFSIEQMNWDGSLLRLFDLEPDKMPKLSYSSAIIGFTTETIARSTGLKAGIPVICGGPDGSMAILGGGGVTPGVAVDVMGTTDVFFGVSDQPLFDKDGSLVNNPHLLPNLWLTGGPMGMTCGTAKWFVSHWRQSGDDENKLMEAHERLANESPAGSLGLLFIPSLTGERTPVWNAAIRGSIIGLTQQHTKGHIYRALLEGNGYSLKNLFYRLEDAGYVFNHYVAIGGGVKNRLGLQIRADITGKKIIVPKVIEASSLGVAILCSLAMNEFHQPQEAVSHFIETDFVIEPHHEHQAIYQQQFKKYQSLMQVMNDFYSKTNTMG